MSQLERLLETYTLEEILEQADLTSLDALVLLVQYGHIKLPEVLPTDIIDGQEIELSKTEE